MAISGATNGRRDVGTCPKCGSYDCDTLHETWNEPDELWMWAQCCECGHQFIEVFKHDRVERWKDFR